MHFRPWHHRDGLEHKSGKVARFQLVVHNGQDDTMMYAAISRYCGRHLLIREIGEQTVKQLEMCFDQSNQLDDNIHDVHQKLEKTNSDDQLEQ